MERIPESESIAEMADARRFSEMMEGPAELQTVLKRSRLQGWRIVEDFMDLTIVKEA